MKLAEAKQIALSLAVMAANKSSRSILRIILEERLIAATRALDNWIRSLQRSFIASWLTMLCSMVSDTFLDFYVVRTVISLDPVDVMYYLSGLKQAPELLTGNQSMFVYISTTVCQWVGRVLNQHITATSDCSTALPLRVFNPRLSAHKV